MAKARGGMRNRGLSISKDVLQLGNSKDWFIRSGMSAIDEDNGHYDMSDMANLSKGEKRIVVAYLSNAYKTVNEALRGNIESKDAIIFSKHLSAALNKLQSFNGETYRTLRFDNIKEQKAGRDLLKDFKFNVGKNITFKEFISTGTDKKSINKKFKGDRFSIDLTIVSKTGKDLRRYNSEEREVLFDKNSSFRVLSVRGNKVRLEQI